MARPRKELDMDVALDLLERGETIPTIAFELGVTPPTLRARIRDLQEKQGVLLQYRNLQSLQLTELQARVLEAITPEKINDASLKDLVSAYKILKEKELVVEGKPSEIKGLMAHLIYLEKQEASLNTPADDRLIDAEYSDEFTPDEPVNGNGKCTTLAELDTEEF